MTRRLLAVVVIGGVITACSGSAADTTTTVPAPTTTVAAPTTTVAAPTTSPPSTSSTVDATVGIRAALGAYLDALGRGEPSAALEFVDGATIDLLEDLLVLAASPVHIDDLNVVDALIVLRLRHRFSGSELEQMSPGDAFDVAFTPDTLPSFGDITFESFNIVGDEATGVVNGSPAMWFVREGGSWKVALARTFDEYTEVLSLMIESRALADAGGDVTITEALVALVSQLEGVEVDPALVSGPRS